MIQEPDQPLVEAYLNFYLVCRLFFPFPNNVSRKKYLFWFTKLTKNTMNKFTKCVFIFILTFVSINSFASNNNNFNNKHTLYIQNISSEIQLEIDNPQDSILSITINGENKKYIISDNNITINYNFNKSGKTEITIITQSSTNNISLNVLPLWLSILPPLIAIAFALMFKEVYTALLLGILSGTFIMFYYSGYSIFNSLINGITDITANRVLTTIQDREHISIIVFSMLIGGMVTLTTRNGGMTGVVNKLSKYASTPRSGQLITWIMGIAIFFDDYANTLVVGNTMRPITDKLRISREKLAYIVDSTAAPIAAIAFVTTWIGAELSYIADSTAQLNIDATPYSILLSSIKFAFYPILTLMFMLILIYKSKDFGPMYKSEKQARKLGIKTEEVAGSLTEANEIPKEKERWFNAAIPVAIIIFGTIAGLIITGYKSHIWGDSNLTFGTKLSETIGSADPYKSLLWSSSFGVIVAILLSVGQKIVSLKNAVESVIDGFRIMLTAMIILVLAWTLATITKELHTAEFLSGILTGLSVPPFLLPAIVFILSAIVAFATGSSWGTMAILYPLILPATWYISEKAGMQYDHAMNIFLNVTSCVLAGSVLGDHCSPISDTTILSSLSSSCNHISHVKTQMPYALTVGAVSVLASTITAFFNINPLYIVIPSIATLYIIVNKFGKSTI